MTDTPITRMLKAEIEDRKRALERFMEEKVSPAADRRRTLQSVLCKAEAEEKTLIDGAKDTESVLRWLHARLDEVQKAGSE